MIFCFELLLRVIRSELGVMISIFELRLLVTRSELGVMISIFEVQLRVLRSDLGMMLPRLQSFVITAWGLLGPTLPLPLLSSSLFWSRSLCGSDGPVLTGTFSVKPRMPLNDFPC
jgi:hypothetical protein